MDTDGSQFFNGVGKRTVVPGHYLQCPKVFQWRRQRTTPSVEASADSTQAKAYDACNGQWAVT